MTAAVHRVHLEWQACRLSQRAVHKGGVRVLFRPRNWGGTGQLMSVATAMFRGEQWRVWVYPAVLPSRANWSVPVVGLRSL